MKLNTKDLERLSLPLNLDVDDLMILASRRDDAQPGDYLSGLMKYYLYGLDDVPIKQQSVCNKETSQRKPKMFVRSYYELLEILQKDHDAFKFNLQIIKSPDLIPIKFFEYPIWSEYYDFDELDEIENWGFDKMTVYEELKFMFVDQQHPYYAVPIAEFPVERMRYFTKAKFRTLNNKELSGYIMNEGEFAISIFTGETAEILTKQKLLWDDHEGSLKRIAAFYKIEIFELFELRYETEIPINVESRIRGTFKLSRDSE